MLCGVVVASWAAAAAAHVAPSTDDNNRYLKLAVAPERVRLAYTVFFGEVPGSAARRTMDADRDGVLAPGEQRAFAEQLGRELAERLTLAVDDLPVTLRWQPPVVGGAEPGTAGAFSVDLVATACLAPARQHRVLLRDAFALPRPGETEVLLEDGPGITLLETKLGAAPARGRLFRFAGAVPALAEPGLSFLARFDALGEATCDAPPQQRGAGRTLTLAVAAVVALALVGGLWWRARGRG